MIRGKEIDDVYYEMSKVFTEKSIEHKLIWEEAKIVLTRMIDDINDNLLEAFWRYKLESIPGKPIDHRNNPYH